MVQHSVYALSIFLLVGVNQAFVPHQTSILTNVKTLAMAGEDEVADPCWQSLLDDDCFMSQMYASNFVAGQWIKSLPCGEGIEDCDMPSALMTPEIFPGSGIDAVDVMNLLDLKRSPTFSSDSSFD